MKEKVTCLGNEQISIPEELLYDFKESFDKIICSSKNTALLAIKIKESMGHSFCSLPFCHTLESEAFGAQIVYDNNAGNRVIGHVLHDLSEIDKLSNICFSKGRIGETIKAISILKGKGEKVIFDVTGPFTIALSLLENKTFFRAIRNNQSEIKKLLNIIEVNISKFIIELLEHKVDLISFSDPVGASDIIGPILFKDLVGKSIVSLLKTIQPFLGNTVIHICNKNSKSLENVGLVRTKIVEVEGNSYIDQILNLCECSNQIKFVGHGCLKSNSEKAYVHEIQLLT